MEPSPVLKKKAEGSKHINLLPDFLAKYGDKESFESDSFDIYNPKDSMESFTVQQSTELTNN